MTLLLVAFLAITLGLTLKLLVNRSALGRWSWPRQLRHLFQRLHRRRCFLCRSLALYQSPYNQVKEVLRSTSPSTPVPPTAVTPLDLSRSAKARLLATGPTWDGASY